MSQKGCRQGATSRQDMADMIILARGYARAGLTNEQIAKNLGIGNSTLYAWSNKHPAFAEALRHGKEPVDFEVENKLLQRALGYSYDETTYEYIDAVDLDGKVVAVTERRKVKVVTKQVAPEVVAQIYWLKNRKPRDWRDRPEEPGTEDNSLGDLARAIRESREVIDRKKAGLIDATTPAAEVLTPGSTHASVPAATQVATSNV